MLFKKLFKLLVVSGAMIGTGTGCAANAQGTQSSDKKAPAADGGVATGSADAGSGGGAQGW
jgi:hypothetical protein